MREQMHRIDSDDRSEAEVSSPDRADLASMQFEINQAHDLVRRLRIELKVAEEHLGKLLIEEKTASTSND